MYTQLYRYQVVYVHQCVYLPMYLTMCHTKRLWQVYKLWRMGDKSQNPTTLPIQNMCTCCRCILPLFRGSKSRLNEQKRICFPDFGTFVTRFFSTFYFALHFQQYSTTVLLITGPPPKLDKQKSFKLSSTFHVKFPTKNSIAMAEGQEESQKKLITILVKTPKEKQSIEIEEDASVTDVSWNCQSILLSLEQIRIAF